MGRKKTKEKTNGYFVQAQSWADDMLYHIIVSRDRYRWAMIFCAVLVLLMTFIILGLLPLKTIQPLLVDHYQDGQVSVRAMHDTTLSRSSALVESDIVRYVENRESYDITSYAQQYQLVNLLSNPEVAKQYVAQQSLHNPSSWVNVLSNKGYSRVHIENVAFLDSIASRNEKNTSKYHYNLAQVDFTVMQHFFDRGDSSVSYYRALVSWQYHKPSDNPDRRWKNWDGFQVTRYSVSQRNTVSAEKRHV